VASRGLLSLLLLAVTLPLPLWLLLLFLLLLLLLLLFPHGWRWCGWFFVVIIIARFTGVDVDDAHGF
jgi:hypothetical protein